MTRTSKENRNAAPPRPVVEGVWPLVDAGRYAVKREQGDVVVVEADAYSDGHEDIWCELRWRNERGGKWAREPMEHIGNDRWRGRFTVDQLGRHSFSVRAGMDELGTWCRQTTLKWRAGQDIELELRVGAELLAARRAQTKGRDGKRLAELTDRAGDATTDPELVGDLLDEMASPDGAQLFWRTTPAAAAVATAGPFPLECERRRARAGAWYELFPRSTADDGGRPGTFKDAIGRLEYVASLGFDVLYLPPVHPIGVTNRKGRDGATVAGHGDPGSTWAIGSEDGGHRAVHPDLGTIEDFDALLAAAGETGLEVALDLAFQCSPDHPWVTEHPEWFRHLPDGTIRYAENPPKRYEDIYPIDFETSEWRALWDALADVVRFWIARGVRIFRVDNPHTKSFRFWEWLIASIRDEHPEVVFLSEAFTRPKVMHHLAKIGFSQSYTYFTWRTAKWELEQYFMELHSPPVAEFLRPNLWPNTPDILPAHLQTGRAPMFMARLVLAATLSASFGIYGPTFELMEYLPRQPGSEEYLHSEKYEIRHWDLDDPLSLAPFVAAVNRARRAVPALARHGNLRFHSIDNEQLVAFSRHERAADGEAPSTAVIVVNLDPDHAQSGWLDLDLGAIDVDPQQPYIVHDLLADASYTWRGGHNYVSLDPARTPAHILRVERDTSVVAGAGARP